MRHAITVELPDYVFELVQHESKLKGKSPAETIVEKIVSSTLHNNRLRDPFFAGTEFYDGEVSADGSLNHDKYIYGEHPWYLLIAVRFQGSLLFGSNTKKSNRFYTYGVSIMGMIYKICTLIFFCTSFLCSQQITKEAIKSSGIYYYGEAIAATEKEATDRALSQLTNSISVTVQSDFSQSAIESSGNFSQTVQSVVKTYSSATLNNVLSLKQPKSSGIEVFLYIAKSEVGKIFEERKELIRDLYERAEEFSRDGSVAEALQYYYFAILLMNSLPERTIEHNGKNLIVEIPARIKETMNNVQFEVTHDKNISEKERELRLRISRNSIPLHTLDFSYWDGTQSVAVQCRDGEGIFRLVGASVKFQELIVDIKYSYYENREEIRELEEVWDLVAKPLFTLKRALPLTIEKKKIISAQTGVYTLQLSSAASSFPKEHISAETQKFLHALSLKNNEHIRKEYQDRKSVV